MSTSSQVLQARLGDLFRRAAVVELAKAASGYQPSSRDDANAVRTAVTAMIDAEAQIAADQGEDDAYAALRALRLAVVQDLTARGASLAPIRTFTFGGTLPALTLSNRLYGSAGRADELISECAPVSPLFMPTTFKALAN